MTWGSYFWEVYSNTMYFDQLVFDVESWSRLWIEINPFYMHFEFAIELYFQKTTQNLWQFLKYIINKFAFISFLQKLDIFKNDRIISV